MSAAPWSRGAWLPGTGGSGAVRWGPVRSAGGRRGRAALAPGPRHARTRLVLGGRTEPALSHAQRRRRGVERGPIEAPGGRRRRRRMTRPMRVSGNVRDRQATTEGAARPIADGPARTGPAILPWLAQPDDVAGHGERLRGGLSSTAEHRIVAPKVTGSKPVGHPNSPPRRPAQDRAARRARVPRAVCHHARTPGTFGEASRYGRAVGGYPDGAIGWGPSRGGRRTKEHA